MPSRPSSLPGPLVLLVVLAAPVLVLSLLLSLVLVAPLATVLSFWFFSSSPGGSDAGCWRLLLGFSPLVFFHPGIPS